MSMRSFCKKEKKQQRGFTLVELMVSLTVFSIVMLVSVGTLLVMVDANAKSQAIYSATTNLSFALDSMTRDMRTGYHYYCTHSTSAERSLLSDSDYDIEALVNPENLKNNCSRGRQLIVFNREIDNRNVGYRYNDVNKTIEYSQGGGVWTPLTSPQEIVIESFVLKIIDNAPYGRYESGNFTTSGLGDTNQPNMDLFVKGYVVNGNGLTSSTTFAIQSHITQRRLDVD